MSAELNPLAVHNADLGALDPVVGRASELRSDGERLVGRAGDSVAVGLSREANPDPDGPMALWVPLNLTEMSVVLAGPERGAALSDLLDQWVETLPAPTPDWQTAAMITVPSRDPVYPNPLIAHGFAPVDVVAVRRGRVSSPAPRPAGVRPATVDDLAALTGMAVALQVLESAHGMATPRASAARLMESSLRRNLDETPGWLWIAESAGEPVGFVQVSPPPGASWMAWATAAGPDAAYLDSMYVRPGGRGEGVGAALAAAAHQALDAVGVPLTALHHSPINPWSGPFWNRNGYRPLWTTWQRRLAGPAS